jgi:hypothetical protein
MNSRRRIRHLLGAVLLCSALVLGTLPAFADASAGSYVFAFSSDPAAANTIVLKMQDGSTVVVNNLTGAFNTCSGSQCSPANGQPIPNQGWWSVPINPNSSENPNYVAGNDGSSVFRNFFSFDLSGVSGTVVGAALELQRFLDASSTSTQVGYNLGHVDGVSAASLNDKSDHTGTRDTDIYGALGNSDFGRFAVTAIGDDPMAPSSHVNDILHFDLTGDAVAALNGALALGPTMGHNYFDIGGSTFDVTANDSSQDASVLTTRTVGSPAGTVPEPASMTLLLAGFGMVAYRLRKNR